MAKNQNGLDRGKNGQFAEGNVGGPGRPRRPVEEIYLLAITRACPPEVWQQVCGRAVEDALAGDAKAREWLSRYLVREPEGETPSLLAAHLYAMRDVDPVFLARADGQIPSALDSLLSCESESRAVEVRELAMKLTQQDEIETSVR